MSKIKKIILLFENSSKIYVILTVIYRNIYATSLDTIYNRPSKGRL